MLRISTFLLAACLALLSGCKAGESLFAGAEKPTLSVVGASIDSLTTDGAGLIFDVRIDNPYSVPLPLANVQYALSSASQPFLSGDANLQGTIPANGNKVFRVPTKIAFAEVLKVAQGVRPGQVVPYTADMTFAVDAPVVGRLKLPVKKEGQLPVPAVPEVSVKDVKWNTTGLTEASGVISLNVKNTNQFAFDLKNVGFNLNLGGKQIASGSVAQALNFAPGQTSTIDVPVSLSLLNAGLGAFSALTGSADKYKVAGTLDLGTPFGPASLGYDSSKK